MTAGAPRALPALSADAHKGDAGRVACVAGSRTMPGAAVLVARAAQRAGAGLVRVGCVDALLLGVLPIAAPEAVLADLADLAGDANDLCARLDGGASHARLAGPGLGDDARARAIAAALLADGFEGPLVLDADALNALDGAPERLRAARGPVVITPHPGEAARLSGARVPRDDDGRAACARALARRSGAICVLKGRRTVVADAERVAFNATGNRGMATAGAGDVLAGILVAYLARARALAEAGRGAVDAFEVARLAAHVHGLAGDLAVEETGCDGLIASDLIAHLPAAQRRLAQG